MSSFSMNAPAAEKQSDNKYKHILFMKTFWSKHTALIVYFMTAIDSGCDSLSLSVCKQEVFCQLLEHFSILLDYFYSFGDVRLLTVSWWISAFILPFGALRSGTVSLFDFTHNTEHWRCVCWRYILLCEDLCEFGNSGHLVQSLVMVYNCLGHPL